jgi:orotidine-5'-phosphate decarboxylase
MGATYPEDAPKMREILSNVWLLKPGYGGQGASAQDSVVGIRNDGFGVVVNNSRNFTYAWQNKKGKHQCEPEKFAEAARLEAIDNRDELVAAATAANKWPF